MQMPMFEDVPINPDEGFRITVTFSHCHKFKRPMAIIHGDKITWHGKYLLNEGVWHKYRKGRSGGSHSRAADDIFTYLSKHYELHIARMVLC